MKKWKSMKKWKFWEDEPVKETPKPKPKIGSFLFATEVNELAIVSIERYRNRTDVIFRDENQVLSRKANCQYEITDKQHEDFVAKISQEIECIVTPGETCETH